MTTSINRHPTEVDDSSYLGGSSLTIREHSVRVGAAVVSTFDKTGKQTYVLASFDDRPRLALAMLGERVDSRIGYMDVEGAADDPRVTDDDLAFFAYRSLAALKLRNERAAEAAEEQARDDEEREAGIEALNLWLQETVATDMAPWQLVALYDAGIRAA